MWSHVAATVTTARDADTVTTYRDLFRYRELFGSLFRRDLRAKYKGSVLGLAWSLAHPLVLMLVYLLVFSVMLKIQAADYEHYWLFLLAGPARLGVLLDLAPVGLAEPGREREPDPQGALPAPARARSRWWRRSSSASS